MEDARPKDGLTRQARSRIAREKRKEAPGGCGPQARRKTIKMINFQLSMRRARKSRRHDTRTFTIDRLLRRDGEQATDVSHLLDRTYHYHSLRELAWHLADRFSLPVEQVEVR